MVLRGLLYLVSVFVSLCPAFPALPCIHEELTTFVLKHNCMDQYEAISDDLFEMRLTFSPRAYVRDNFTFCFLPSARL
jgi:hypothetical protein